LNLEYTTQARRDLDRLDPPVQRRVLGALGRLANDGTGDVQRLTGTDGEYRLRVGDWRVRFRRDRQVGVVVVLRVLPRGRAYRD